MSRHSENRIEKWQWWLLVAWLLFIVPVGVVIVYKVSGTGRPRRVTTTPVYHPYTPASPAPFKLGDGPEIEIRGRVLMPDGSPAPRHTMLITLTVKAHHTAWNSGNTDDDGYYTAKANVGAKFMAVVNDAKLTGRYASTVVATDVCDPPTPGQYDIQLHDNPLRIHGRLLHPDGTPAPGRDVSLQVYGFGRVMTTTYQDATSSGASMIAVTHATKSDADGRYEFLVMPGEFTLSVDTAEDPNVVNVEIGLVAGDSDKEFDFTVRPTSRFRFVLPDGTVPEHKVKVRGWRLNENHRVTNDYSLRNFIETLEEPDGSHGLILSRALTRFAVQTQDGRYGAVLDFKGLTTIEPLTVTLRESAKLRLCVVDRTDGKPLVGYPVSCQTEIRLQDPASGFSTRHTDLPIKAETDENGVAILGPLYVGGEYYVQISDNHMSNPEDRPTIRPLDGGTTIDLGTFPLDGYLDDYKSEKSETEEDTTDGSETSAEPGEQGHDE